MAAPKKITPEKILQVVSGLKKLKRLTKGAVCVGVDSAGNKMYHYPKITKALIAKGLGVNKDYLVSIKDPDVQNAMQDCGQMRRHRRGTERAPNPNTKADLLKRNKKLNEKIKVLEVQVGKAKQAMLRAAIEAERYEDLIEEIGVSVERNRELEKTVREQEGEIRGCKMRIAVLESKIARQ